MSLNRNRTTGYSKVVISRRKGTLRISQDGTAIVLPIASQFRDADEAVQHYLEQGYELRFRTPYVIELMKRPEA
jgi:hypothetical protein